jgi:hypothetical protein
VHGLHALSASVKHSQAAGPTIRQATGKQPTH